MEYEYFETLEYLSKKWSKLEILFETIKLVLNFILYQNMQIIFIHFSYHCASLIERRRRNRSSVRELPTTGSSAETVLKFSQEKMQFIVVKSLTNRDKLSEIRSLRDRYFDSFTLMEHRGEQNVRDKNYRCHAAFGNAILAGQNRLNSEQYAKNHAKLIFNIYF